jgi:hypothetical protein
MDSPPAPLARLGTAPIALFLAVFLLSAISPLFMLGVSIHANYDVIYQVDGTGAKPKVLC